MGSHIVLLTVNFHCSVMISLATPFADVHVVLFAHSEPLCQVRDVSLFCPLPSFFWNHSCLVESDKLFPLLELEAGAIKLEESHDCFAVEHTLFEVTILLSVEIFFTLGSHVV